MNTDQKRIETFLKPLAFFSGLEDADIRPIFESAQIHHYAKNQHLFFHGDRAEKFYIVINGCIKVYSETLEGDESVLLLVTQGMHLGEASIFDGAIHPFSASAAENSEVVEIPATILKSQAQKSAPLTARVMSVLSDELRNSQREKEHMAIMTAEQRVGCMLLRLSASMLGKGGTFTLPYDKSLAAANLGMKPETFSRALKQLGQYGVHIKGPEVTINNFANLANHCCAHCSSTADCNGDKRECSGQTEHCPRPHQVA